MGQGRHLKTNHANGRKRNAHTRRGRSLKAFLSVAAVLLVVLGVSFSGLLHTGWIVPTVSGLFAPAATATPAPTQQPTPTPAPTPVVETVTFSATGDNLIHSAIYEQAQRNATGDAAYDFSSCYAHMADFYADYDVNWINQETLVNSELEPSTYPCFSTPGECAQALYDIGFRVFSLSNNHSYDKGSTGIAATRRFWSGMPSDVVTTGLWAGSEDYDRIPTQTVNGITIAYLSYTEHTNGIPTPSQAEAHVIYTSETDVIQHQVQLARQQADVVVVGVHWGVEDSHTITDAQRALAQNLADWGADLIIGTHPHVLQDAQWLTAADGRQAFVAYSLGNFISTQKQADNLVGGVLTLTMQKTTQPDGTVSVALQQPKIHPVVTHYSAGTQDIATYLYRDYTPELASSHGARNRGTALDYDRITSIIETNISPEFLDMN